MSNVNCIKNNINNKNVKRYTIKWGNFRPYFVILTINDSNYKYRYIYCHWADFIREKPTQRQYNNIDTVIKSYRVKAFVLEISTQIIKIHMRYICPKSWHKTLEISLKQ